jgi:nucleotide-binding universal stress UspA family protein
MSNSSPKILVPVGFSEQSFLAIQRALIFAKLMKAEITLLTVMEGNGFFKKMFNSDKSVEELKPQVKEKLREVAEEYGKDSGVKFDVMVSTGIVYEEVAKVSEIIDADLVVMGTNGKPQNFRKRFIGSNAYRVVTLVKPPVVTIKGVRDIKNIDTIIFPLVLDRRSKEKVGPALHYARLFQAKIKIVSVLESKEKAPVLRAHIKQVATFINDHGIECTAELINPEEKGVVRNLLNYAYQNDGDLIIITEDDGERDITDYILGSDVQAIVYHSEIPVMCITPSEVKWERMWDSF